MLLPKFLSQKKLSRKYRTIFGLKNRSCDRRNSSPDKVIKQSREMDRELILADSGGKLLPERVLFLETKEHPLISNASFRKRGRENVFLQMF